ncbi:MAG: ABC transporter permease subunit [Clostridium sp.]|nr:ABC transporter permease subunit [Clostridium sp.]
MKLFNLVTNELEKQFKKPSIKIIIVLILITAIFLPIVVNKIPSKSNVFYNLENDKFQLEQSKEYEDSLKNDKTTKGQIRLKYASIDREFMEVIVANEIPYEDWRRKEAEELKFISYELASIEFAINGIPQDVVMENLIGTDPSKVDSYYKLSVDKRKEIQSNLTAKKEQIKNIITTKDHLNHTQEEINRKKQLIEDNKKTIAAYNELKSKKVQTEEEKARLSNLEIEAQDAEKLIVQYEEDIKILEFRLSNKIDYDKNNWKNNSIETVEKELMELRTPLMTEKQYTSTAAQQGYTMTYDEYVKNYNETNNKRKNKIKEVWYGIENNIPDLKDVNDARSVLNRTYEIYIVLGVILVIIIGGGMVASEFSKGTIRLLLIRPVSRWKVLLSKLLSLLIIGFAVSVIGIVILSISTGFVYGMDTYKIPLLETYNNGIIEVNFFKYLIPKIALSSISIIFIASLVFMISTLAKNTALAVAISMVLYLGTPFITELLVSMNQIWIVNTFIPYINSSYFRLMPMTEEILASTHGMAMNFLSGGIQLLILSILMLIITFGIFIKKDVKN